ncbi:proto-oncogene DBL isoform X2 [Corythoichthys intestinalis]|uniref:proto-oncogene DBL isoform X2 n=1 Tax=Corythoichthys intestinalis TaxID=161448 RepID=UPI0025A68F87|nr:proto-oncogene DBL isoform X2 [Corythoichthys intestinalis]
MAETCYRRGLVKIRTGPASFPGNLHLVLVLRPTSFFHRTVTDIGFRFSQEDFMLKMPVVMLSSVTDLLKYINENQLTSEFGGTLDYCHSDWIVLRTAIESFAVTVKDVAHMLQAFGTELAEVAVPGQGDAIRNLLESHNEKYRKLKEAIGSLSQEGQHLLSSLETTTSSSTARDDHEPHWDIQLDWETVQRLLGQLRDMELAFDGYFEKHRLKLQQYLQLLAYEQSFHEMESCLAHTWSQQSQLSSSVDTLDQAEQALKQLDSLESIAQEAISSAQTVILHGHQLSAGHHYATALIMQRCNELRHRCDTLHAALGERRGRLLRAQRLLVSLQQAQTWCDDGAYLLANQLVEKFQSKEGARTALKAIEGFLEGSPPVMTSGPDILALEYEDIMTPQLQMKLNQTFEKHTAVQQMIQNRQVGLRKLADKHVRPVQLVAPRAENPPRSKSPIFSPKHADGLKFTFDLPLPGKRASRKGPNARKIEVIHDYQENRSCVSYGVEGEDSPRVLKRHVMRELIETERIYVEELLSVLLGYKAEMDDPLLAALLPPVLRAKRAVLFGNMPDIYDFHSSVFLGDLEGCLDAPEGVGVCFLARKENFQMYECYCQNKPRSDALWRQFSDCAFFQECQKKLGHKLALDSYLLKPVQRLTKYQLLLKELLKHSTDCDGSSELQGALSAMLDLLKSVNDSMHQIAITGYEGDICELGRVLMQGSFSVWMSHKRGPTRVKELARFKPMQRHLFLYESVLLFCKKREEHGDGGDKTPSYAFKNRIKLTAVGITENVRGDPRKFEIWYSGRGEVYVVQAPNIEVKTSWLSELRRILTNQQKLLRDEVHQNGQLVDRMHLSTPPCESKQERASVSSEDTESGRGSPDARRRDPKHQLNRRSWPGAHHHSANICEALDEANTRDAFHQLETQPKLSQGRYRALADFLQNGPESFLIKSGDVIQLVCEDRKGRWLVKNLSRHQDGFVASSSLQLVIRGNGPDGSCRLRETGNVRARKLSSP